ncbi:MAG TPA: UbiD family decarboxylase, partial [Methylomirabilota bacterium]|nr:UbiD family decarboxylase [Methylomirabilota bacterium]
ATRFTAIQIRQRYPGHSRNVLHVASNCMAGAYNGKWTVVVDDDVDCSDIDQVLWAMGTRFDPLTDIDIVQKAWSSGRDPMFLPGNFNNRILIDACIPYNRKLRSEFPKVVEVPEDVRAKLKAKFPQIFK